MRISCKKCRRLGTTVCGREKCAIRRKPYPPGMQGKNRRRRRDVSEFAKQLREKQVVRHSYGISERQFRGYVTKALAGHGGDVAKKLTESLEMRLDNVVFRLGFASSRSGARQLVAHGHISVNGRKVHTPSYKVKEGQSIIVNENSRSKGVFKNQDIVLKKHETPPWLLLEPAKWEGNVTSLPKVEDMVRLYNIKSIIEYYSR
ncbi:MAG: 30S ribosomal protein S4 [bacterium]|nr:30S ribosomal protein S4 [bacterium]